MVMVMVISKGRRSHTPLADSGGTETLDDFACRAVGMAWLGIISECLHIPPQSSSPPTAR